MLENQIKSIQIPDKYGGKSIDGAIKRVFEQASVKEKKIDKKEIKELTLKPEPLKEKYPQADCPFLLRFDGEYGSFAYELIVKNNENFKGTRAEMDLNNTGFVNCNSIIKRFALVTTIANNPQLRSVNLWPISPLESEEFLKKRKLPKAKDSPEELAFVYYGRTRKKYENPKESSALYESLYQERKHFGLKKDDMKKKFLIVDCGLVKDENMPYGVKPRIIPGVTEIYFPEIMNEHPYGGNSKVNFIGYGFDNGIPFLENTKDCEGKVRKFDSPSSNSKGTFVLIRFGNSSLYASSSSLVNYSSNYYINFISKKR